MFEEIKKLIGTVMLIALFVAIYCIYWVATHPVGWMTYMACYIVFICLWACVDSYKRKKYPERYQNKAQE